MGHTAAVYKVRVRGSGRGRTTEFFPFGDIDDEGTDLAEVLIGYLNGLVEESESREKTVSCTSATLTATRDLQVLLQHGQTGVAADIVGPGGAHRIRQHVVDTQNVKCGALFRLPLDADMGWLAVHVNNGRGVKGLLCSRLASDFRDDFSKRVLDIEPCVSGAVLRQALEDERMDKVKLVRTVQANDIGNPARKWVPGGTIGKIELDISGKRMMVDRVKRFLNGDDHLFNEIVTYEGLVFDEAKVEVQLEGGGRRTYNIAKPESGHPMTVDLEHLRLQDGDPTDRSLFRALGDVLDELVTA